MPGRAAGADRLRGRSAGAYRMRCDTLQPVETQSYPAVRRITSCALAIFLSCAAAGSAQQAPPPQPARPGQSGMSSQPGQSGIAGGMNAPAQYDEQKRPITAGAFVEKGQAPIVFEDITKRAGLSGWVHKMGVPEKKFIVETNGSGLCLVDFDNDG